MLTVTGFLIIWATTGKETDIWLCKDDKWIKQGNPPYEKPFDEECGIVDKAMGYKGTDGVSNIKGGGVERIILPQSSLSVMILIFLLFGSMKLNLKSNVVEWFIFYPTKDENILEIFYRKLLTKCFKSLLNVGLYIGSKFHIF